MGAFLQDLSQALEEAGATLSVLVSNEELTGASADSGVTAASLAGISGRVWTTAETGPDALTAALTGAGWRTGRTAWCSSEKCPQSWRGPGAQPPAGLNLL